MLYLNKIINDKRLLKFIAEDISHTFGTTLISLSNNLVNIDYLLDKIKQNGQYGDDILEQEITDTLGSLNKVKTEVNASLEYLDILNKTLSQPEINNNFSNFSIKSKIITLVEEYPYKTQRERQLAINFSRSFRDVKIFFNEESFVFIIKRIIKFVLCLSPINCCQMDFDIISNKNHSVISVKTNIKIDKKIIKKLNNLYYISDDRVYWGFSQVLRLFSKNGYSFVIETDDKKRVNFIMNFLKRTS